MMKKYVAIFLAAVMLGSTSIAVFGATMTWEFASDVNVSNQDTTLDKKEAHIMRSATDSNKLVAGFIDYAGPGGTVRCRTANSSNGGSSWTVPSGSFPPLPAGTNHSSDPVIAVSGSTWYIVCVAFPDFMYSSGDVTKIFYSTSTDGGTTWSSPTVVKTETCVNSTNCPEADKPWIEVSGSNVYVCWARYDNILANPTGVHIKFKKVGGTELNLADGTHDDSGTRVGDRSVQGCNITVNSGGIVYVAWSHLTGDSTGAMELKRSFNSGGSFESTVQTIQTFTRTPTQVGTCTNEYGCVQGINLGGTTGFRAPNFPYMDTDSSNRLHVAYMDYSSSTLTNVKYTKSTDCTTQGQNCTFITGVNVLNDGGIARDQILPSIVFSEKTDAVHITSLDRRDSLTAWKAREYHCHINSNSCALSSHWTTSTITSEDSTNFDGSAFIGDYYAVTSNSAREAYDLWVDDRIIGTDQHYRIFSDRTTA